MLTSLRIENFAIIDHLEVDFGSGLVTLTGETGAGKSILLDAILQLMGGRADATMVRSGADRANVEGAFTLSPEVRAEVNPILEREGLDDEGDLLLAREIRKEGRSIARINGRSVSGALLKEIGRYLVDIHGQSEHLSLLDPREHLRLLDRYAACAELAAPYHATWLELRDLRRELHQLQQDEADSVRQMDLLTYQIQEIETAALKEGEEEALTQEKERLANAESLAELAQRAVQSLEDSSPESPAVNDLLGGVLQALGSLCRIDKSQLRLHELAVSAADQLNEVSLELQDYIENIEYNPRRLEQVIERLDLLRNLTRKYGGSVSAVQSFAASSRARLESITHAGERIAELTAREHELLTTLAGQAQALSSFRQEAAARMSAAIESELDDLSMPSAQFKVDFKHAPSQNGLTLSDGSLVSFDASGIDQVEFLIAPNPGEGLKPLVKIASGGETSRLMLGLKNVLVQADPVPTLIFDEIDQGIGGRVGSVIGEKLWQLGRAHQVLCVTHLPQLAAFGDQHFKVHKTVTGGRTTTVLTPLDQTGRLNELAQMLGADSAAGRQTAAETLENARNRVKSLKSA